MPRKDDPATYTKTNDAHCPVQAFSQAVEDASFPVIGSDPVSACVGGVCNDDAWQ